MNSYYDFSYGTDSFGASSATDENLAIFVVLIVLLVYAVMGICLLINYILSSLALTSLASRRSVENAWLAWLPIGCDWVLGALVDRLEGSRGVSRKWGRLLLILNLIFVIGFVGIYIALFAMMISIVVSAEFADAEMVLSMILPIYALLIPIILVGSAAAMLRWLCTYKVYEELVPEKVVKYSLISLLVPFGRAICLMKCKNSSAGVCPPPSYFSYGAPPPFPPQADNNSSPDFGYEIPKMESEPSQENKEEQGDKL